MSETHKNRVESLSNSWSLTCKNAFSISVAKAKVCLHNRSNFEHKSLRNGGPTSKSVIQTGMFLSLTRATVIH